MECCSGLHCGKVIYWCGYTIYLMWKIPIKLQKFRVSFFFIWYFMSFQMLKWQYILCNFYWTLYFHVKWINLKKILVRICEMFVMWIYRSRRSIMRTTLLCENICKFVFVKQKRKLLIICLLVLINVINKSIN
jgi:hypothetical protein